MNRKNKIIENNETEPAVLSLRLKLLIIFVDYIIIIAIVSIISNLSVVRLEQNHPWLFRLVIYLIYYVFSEYFFRKTLGMKFFGVFIFNKKSDSLNKRFLIYSLLIFFDRFLLLVIYIFRLLFFTDKKLLNSEKYSGLRWIKCKI